MEPHDVSAIVDALLGAVGKAGEPPPDDVWHFVDWPTAWTKDRDDAQWLAEPIIAAARGHAWYAPAKAGKSFVLLQICAALATGRPIFDGTKPARRRVLYLDYEMTEEDIIERLEQYGYGPDDDLSWLHYAMLPSLPELNSSEGGKYLLSMAERLGVALVVIDTTSRALNYGTRDEQSSRPYQEFYQWCGKPLKAAGIAWMRVAHAGKDKERGQRGSSAQNDDVDVVWRLDRTDGGVKLTATHRRMGWVPEHIELAEVKGDGCWFHKLAPSSMPSYPDGTAECAKALDELEVPITAPNRTAGAILRAAVKEGRFVVKTGSDVISAAVRYRRERLARTDITELERALERTYPQANETEPGTEWNTSVEQVGTPGTAGEATTWNTPPTVGRGVPGTPDFDDSEDDPEWHF